MRNYLAEGKKKSTLDPYRVSDEDAYLVNERYDNFKLDKKILKNSVLVNVSLKEAEISNCDFSYSTFINCYFRGAKFRGCNFTGCKFIECNFRSATLLDCKIIYTKWKETYIKREIVLANIPSAPNLAQDLLISLRMNASSIGEYEDSKYFLYQSEKLSRLHLWYIATKYSSYYDKYNGWQRISSLLSLIRSYIEKYLWGYGERPATLCFSGGMIVLGFSFIFLVIEPKHFGLGNATPNLFDSLFEAGKVSVLTFSGNIPSNLPPEVYIKIGTLLTLESLLGIVFIAFLAASLHRKISTRRD